MLNFLSSVIVYLDSWLAYGRYLIVFPFKIPLDTLTLVLTARYIQYAMYH